MPATAEKLEGSRVRLAVEVPPEDLQKEYGRAIQRVGRRVKVPGFRPGKAPRRLVENAAGVGTVMQDLLEAVVPRAYTSALSETGVNPIDQPELDVPELPSLDAPFLFSAEVAVAPTVELGDLDDVSISVPVEEVAEDEIDAEIEQLRVTQGLLGTRGAPRGCRGHGADTHSHPGGRGRARGAAAVQRAGGQ